METRSYVTQLTILCSELKELQDQVRMSRFVLLLFTIDVITLFISFLNTLKVTDLYLMYIKRKRVVTTRNFDIKYIKIKIKKDRLWY